MNIYFDIETIPTQCEKTKERVIARIKAPANYKDGEKIAEYIKSKSDEEWLKTSFDGAYGHICSIAVAINNEDPVAFYGDDVVKNEIRIITNFFDYLNFNIYEDLPLNVRAIKKTTFVGHNLIDFDLRFLFQRCVILGIKPPEYIPFNAKHWEDCVFDTMTSWSGLKSKVSMDKLVCALGGDVKGDLDGSKVWEYVKSGRISEVAEYNKNDVIRTRFLHSKLTFSDVA